VLGAACESADPPADSAPPTRTPPYNDATLPPDSPAAPRPHLGTIGMSPRAPTMTDSIRIEGMLEASHLRLVRSPAGMQPAFSVYVPESFEVDFDRDGSDAVRFTAAFAGRANPDAYVQVLFYPPGTSESLARESVVGFAQSRSPGANAEPADRFDWAIDQYRFQYGTPASLMTGAIALGVHDGRFFHVLIHYPAEYGDGMGPRVARMLESWRWETAGLAGNLTPSRGASRGAAELHAEPQSFTRSRGASRGAAELHAEPRSFTRSRGASRGAAEIHGE